MSEATLHPGVHAGTATMRSAVLAGPGTVRIEERGRPEPGQAQVRVRLEGSGVCASNLPVWEGRPWFTYPLEPGAPGHEGWGVVDAVGDEVDWIEPGTRVAALSYHAYAEYDLVEASAVVPIPPSLDGAPVPGEPLGCAMNIFRRSDVQPGHTVAIIGIGFLGALLTQLAGAAGARVVAISRRAFSLEVARQCGAAHTLPLASDRGATVRAVQALTDGALCDRVIECVGLQEPLDLAGELTRERGRLVIAGFHQDGARQVNLFLWNWRGLDVVNAHERDPRAYVAGMRDAIDAITGGRLDPTALYTHRVPLAELGRALELTRARPDGFLKALIES